MYLKNVIIPLCDLRLQQNFDRRKVLGDVMTLEMSPNKTYSARRSAASKEIKKNTNLRSETHAEESEEEEDESYEVKKVQGAKKKIVKILDVNEEEDDSSEESNYEEEDDVDGDPDFDIKEEIEEIDKKENVPVTTIPKRNLSAYELMIQKNREENKRLLQSLGIEQAKVDLTEAIGNVKKRQHVKRKYKEVEKDSSPPVLRRSRRIANIDIDFSEDALYSNALKAAVSSEESRKTIPSEMSFKEALASEDFYESYVADVSFQETKSEAKFVTYNNFLSYCRGFTKFLSIPWKLYVAYKRNSKPTDDTDIQEQNNLHSKYITYNKSDLNKMIVSESNIAKVAGGRITALTWYSSPEQLIVTAGDKYGNLGVWNVDKDSYPYIMKIHLEGITNLQFSPYNQIQLMSSSYDGILRCGDMVQNRFNEIYNVSQETSCTYFDFLSSTTFLVAQKNGEVVLVDRRTEGKSCEKKLQCHDYSIKTVNIHPVNRTFFITAENKGPIRLWDLRKLQKKPVADITHHKRCVQSAYFSPVTGNSILATSADDTISIFDSTKLTSEIKLKQLMKHNNQTGRWLSVFRATWLPHSEEAFVIGSMQFPRRIEVYDKHMFAYSMMSHENFTTITSTNAFHPSRPALAGGNSSGKVFVFT